MVQKKLVRWSEVGRNNSYIIHDYDMVLTTKTIRVNLELNGETQNSETLNRIMFTYTLGKDYLSSNMSCSNCFLTAEEREFFTPSSSSLEYSPPRPFMYTCTRLSWTWRRRSRRARGTYAFLLLACSKFSSWRGGKEQYPCTAFGPPPWSTWTYRFWTRNNTPGLGCCPSSWGGTPWSLLFVPAPPLPVTRGRTLAERSWSSSSCVWSRRWWRTILPFLG